MPPSGLALFRPDSLKELELIDHSNFRAFPPRLPEQPIFYPVLNFEYAAQIAKDWNTKSPPYAGFVTKFEIDSDYASKFEIHTVGSKTHQELWVPAEELQEFNQHILGKIVVEAVYYGPLFDGQIDSKSNLPASFSLNNHL